MDRKLTDLLPNPGRLLRNAQKALTGGALTALGLFSTQPVNATPLNQLEQTALSTTTIVDRSRKVTKFVLSLPGNAFKLVAQHRSHASHASHASHSSHVSGANAPAAPRVPPSVRPAPPATSSSDGTDPTAAVTSSFTIGTVTKIDPLKRTFTVKESATSSREFSYRDSTMYASRSVIQDLADVNDRLPFKLNDKVRITWKTTDNRNYIATEIREQP